MEPLIEKVDKTFAECDKPNSPGCALAVVKDGEIIYKKGYGVANLEYDIPITPKTIFHVASVSKQFTAMAIVLLAQEGKLSLEDDVRQYIPELPDFGETITIRHLIHHTSGLRDQWSLLEAAGWRLDDVITTDDVMELVRRQRELNFKPGAEYLYCNTGYTLLAVIAERVSGKSFRDFCDEHIFQPLGMHNTHFHDDHRTIVKNRAYSYSSKDEGGFQHAVLSYATVGATSLFTTVEDLSLWDQNFYDGTVGGATVTEEMETRGILNDGGQLRYAFGLNIGEYKGLKVVEHSGGDAGYRSHLMRFPEQRFSMAILCNLGTMNPSELARRVANIYLSNIFPEEEATKEEDVIKLSEEELASKAGVYYNATTVTVLRLEMREGKLVVARTRGPGQELLPFTKDLFRLATSPQTEVRFTKSTDGTLQMQWAREKDKPIIYEAVTAFTPTEEENAAYVGDYYSPELDVSCRVMLQEDQLVLKRRKYGESTLLPAFRDGFTIDGSLIVFSRDEKDNISGVRLTTGRVRNLKFIRRNV